LCCAPLTGGWGAQPLWDAGSGALDPAGDGGAAESRPRRAPNLPAAHCWPLAGRRRSGAADHDVRARRREGRIGACCMMCAPASRCACLMERTSTQGVASCQLLQGKDMQGCVERFSAGAQAPRRRARACAGDVLGGRVPSLHDAGAGALVRTVRHHHREQRGHRAHHLARHAGPGRVARTLLAHIPEICKLRAACRP